MHKSLIAVLLSTLFCVAHAGDETSVNALQKQWAQIKYEMPDDNQQKAFETLIEQAARATATNPVDADLLIWEGIIRASYAGVQGGLGALGEVKNAKSLFEKAIAIDPQALSGSVFTSLGSLYYQVPGWPIGFGSDKKAEEMLKMGLEYNPVGIDSNFFYADYLLDQGDYEKALVVFEKPYMLRLEPAGHLQIRGASGKLAPL